MANKVIVGVSGGPDSMYLLTKIYRKRLHTPVAVHVNYNFREESVKEMELVKEFCKRNKIEFHILDVTKEVKEKYSHISNKQSMARRIRYDFYKQIANELGITKVFLSDL